MTNQAVPTRPPSFPANRQSIAPTMGYASTISASHDARILPAKTANYAAQPAYASMPPILATHARTPSLAIPILSAYKIHATKSPAAPMRNAQTAFASMAFARPNAMTPPIPARDVLSATTTGNASNPATRAFVHQGTFAIAQNAFAFLENALGTMIVQAPHNFAISNRILVSTNAPKAPATTEPFAEATYDASPESAPKSMSAKITQKSATSTHTYASINVPQTKIVMTVSSATMTVYANRLAPRGRAKMGPFAVRKAFAFLGNAPTSIRATSATKHAAMENASTSAKNATIAPPTNTAVPQADSALKLVRQPLAKKTTSVGKMAIA